MATKPENTFREGVHRHLKGKPVHHEKMSNPYSSGTADDWYSGKGQGSSDLWIEYKYIPRQPQRGSVKISKLFSALQLEWLTGRHREGRNVAVIIGSPNGGLILLDEDWGLESVTVEYFNSRVRSRPDLAAWIREQVEGKSCSESCPLPRERRA